MKVMVIITSLFVIASSYPTVKTWSLNELSEVIEKNEGDPEMMPYYVDALNTIMYALFTGENEAAIHVNILSPRGKKMWTLQELRTALEDPTLNKALRPYYERSYYYLMNEGAGNEVEVVYPGLDISTWSLEDLLMALEDPDTKPALKPFLVKAIKEIKEQIDSGVFKDHISMVTPVGLVPVRNGEKSDFVARIMGYKETQLFNV